MFYAFPYIALGRLIAENDIHKKEHSKLHYVICLCISLILLSAESLVFVLIYHTGSTIIWLSVLPCTYYFFMLIKRIEIPMSKEKSVFLRKMSTLIYVNHGLFVILFNDFKNFKYFIAVSILSSLSAAFIIVISEKKAFKWLKAFY